MLQKLFEDRKKLFLEPSNAVIPGSPKQERIGLQEERHCSDG